MSPITDFFCTSYTLGVASVTAVACAGTWLFSEDFSWFNRVPDICAIYKSHKCNQTEEVKEALEISCKELYTYVKEKKSLTEDDQTWFLANSIISLGLSLVCIYELFTMIQKINHSRPPSERVFSG